MTDDAAERLRELLKGSRQEGMTGEEALRDRFAEWEHAEEWNLALDQALAAERRATVDRIRAAVDRLSKPKGSGPLAETAWHGRSNAIDAILDAEADR